jgi:hypothetical protein
MKRPLFVKTSPINDRVSKLETVVSRLAIRSRKTASAMITPYPISNAVFGDDVRGVILRYMFPCNGSITKGSIRLGKKPKNGITIDIKVFNDAKSDSRGFTVSTKRLSIEPSPKFETLTGDCLEVSLTPVTEEDKVTEVWISFLWTPDVAQTDIRQILIEDLEKNIDDFIED